MMCHRKLTPAEHEERLAKKREGMRKIRHRQRQKLQQMKITVVELEKQYAELCRRAEATPELPVYDELLDDQDDEQGHPDLAMLTKQLGAEKLLLQTMLKQKTTSNVELDIVDEIQAEDEFGFYPLTEWDLTRTMLDNKRVIRHVENRLHPPSGLVYVDKRTHRMEAFGWEIIQRVEGSVMEFVFLKKITNLNVLDIMHKTWINDIKLARFKTVKAETSHLEVLQEMNPNAFVFVRDVDSPSAISTFWSIFVHYSVEAAKEFHDSVGGTLTGTDYVLGTQSVATGRPIHSIEQDEAGRKRAWADLTLTTEAYDVKNPVTGEKYQQIVWAGKTDYCTEEDAQRNAADTLQGLLR